ncbi:GPI ethanolamine phosphate transferase 3 [[Candida] railenensis]|uniref:GPI ethanolamine phosphate transferase 3 n=1 Tax=[Candida] railenensis TaxID=45579 RepID=A0A9P0VXJ6_9ASCO|nr:GPI ethanolamine phosphate transferase 3 [[Candida] railenensis]
MEESPINPSTPKDEVELNDEMKIIDAPSVPVPTAAGATSPEDDPLNGILQRQRLLRQQQQQKQQLQGRIRVRQQKLKMTFFGYIMVLIFFAMLQFIGVITFTQGFLLSRNVLPDIADSQLDPQLVMSTPPVYDKMILLVIDALRFDFVIPVEDENEKGKPYHNQFPVLYEMFQKYPENSILLKFLADPPTTTLQRLKGLTTGSLPTFIDAGSNFDGDAIDEDNWLLQLHKHNKSIAFMGDDTWKALFTEYINPDLFFPFDSLNVWDLHTVDNGVIDNMMPLLEKKRQPEWDVLIGHFLGVDHVGHRYGPDHNAMKPKLSQMDDVIRQVIEKLDSNTLLCVMGDHGMDSTGNHGGDSKDELESTLFMYSKNKKSGFKRMDQSEYNVDDLGANFRTVNQIDLVPTLSLLLGLPIPHNNLGSPIQEVFGKNFQEASIKTTKQIQKFRTVAGLDEDESLNDIYVSIIEGGSDPSTIEFSKAYQSKFLEQCKAMWATFDLKLIIIGVLILFASFTFVVTYSRLIPSVRVSTMSFEFIGSVIAMMLLGLVLSFSVYVVLGPVDFSFRRCAAIGSSIGIFVGLWAPIMDRFSVAWLLHQLYDFFIYNFNGWSVLGISFIIGHSLIFASNSFVVWEDKMIHFFIQTFGFYCLAQCTIKISSKKERVLAIAHCISFLIMSRLISGITLCREEQQPYCQSNFQTSWWSILGLYGVALILPRMVKSFYTLSDSYHSAAPLWIGTGLTFLLYGNAIYWTLEYVQSNNGGDSAYVIIEWLENFKIVNDELPINRILTNLQSIFSSVSKTIFLAVSVGEPLIVSIKLAIARISMFITLILANYSWSRGPLCVKLSEQSPSDDYLAEEVSDEDASNSNSKKNSVVILGYQNVYGSSYFLLVLNFAIPIMLVTKPLGAISLSMLLIQILTLLELFQILNLRGNLISPVMFGLIAYQHFYSTGHQATLQSIQWDVGFITTETITFPFTHLNLALNTFGSFILISIAVPLITLWKIPPSSKPITVLSQIVTNVTSLLTYQTIISTSSLAFAGHFRRHLMVWKIFAPRFMLSGILLLSMNVIMIVITVWFGSGKLLTQVNRIFGK